MMKNAYKWDEFKGGEFEEILEDGEKLFFSDVAHDRNDQFGHFPVADLADLLQLVQVV